MTRDLTEGKPLKLIVSFALPLIFGFLFQQLYNLVDTLIVGRFLGTSALASVGATGSLNFLILGFLMGVCSGFSIPVAQAFGAKDIRALRRYVVNGAMLSAALSLAVMLLTLLLLRRILTWTNTPADIFEGSYRYLGVILLGIPATIFYNFLASVIRALGDSRTPVVFLVVASLVNIALDLLFIVAFGMGVEGAALATVLSQALSGLLCYRHVRKNVEILMFTRKDWVADFQCLRKLLLLGLPMGLQYSITAIGSVILQTSVNGVGSAAVASVTAGSKISMLFTCMFDALASTATTYAGQNLGAGKVERVRGGLAAESLVGVGYSLLALGVVTLLGRPMVRLFVDAGETAIVEDAYRFLFVNACFYIPLLYVNILRLTIQGLGYTPFAVFAGVFEMIARAAVGLLLVPAFGFDAACFASPAAWVMADLFLVPATAHVLRAARQKSGRERIA